MAEHELNKIVDDSGEVFNLRDSTKQPTADRVTAWGSTPSDTKYPSEKLVKDSLDAKVSSIKKNGSTITPSSGVADIGYMPVTEAQSTATVQNLIQALRVKPGGRLGSVMISASTIGSVAIASAWYNYIWIPHRTGSSTDDNQNYGTLVLTPMTTAPDVYVIEGQNLSGSSPTYRAKRLGNDASFLYANLAWGGAFRTSLSPFDNYAFKSANCFFGAKPSAIRVEYSTDGGTTWVDYGLTDAQRQNLLSQYGTISVYCGHNKHIQPGYTGSIVGTKDLSDENIADQRLRITICDSSLANEGTTGSTDRWLYCLLRRIGIYMSTQSATAGAHCLFERRTSANFKSGTDTWVSEGDYRIQGDSGWNSIPCHNATEQDGITFGMSDSHTREIRFTIWSDKLNATPAASQTGNLCIYKIVAYSELLWTNNSSNPNVGNFGSPYAINSETGVTSFSKGITSGVAIPIGSGGTGATTAIGAEYNILNQVADIDTTINGDRKIALCNQTKSASNGVFRWLKLSNVWTWIKGLLSSESGVNISGSSTSCTGNAATATTAQNYNSSTGTIKTALEGKRDIYGDFYGEGTSIYGWKIGRMALGTSGSANCYMTAIVRIDRWTKLENGDRDFDSFFGVVKLWARNSSDGTTTWPKATIHSFKPTAFSSTGRGYAIFKKSSNSGHTIDWYIGLAPDSDSTYTPKKEIAYSLIEISPMYEVNFTRGLERVSSDPGFDSWMENCTREPWLAHNQYGAGSSSLPVYVDADNKVVGVDPKLTQGNLIRSLDTWSTINETDEYIPVANNSATAQFPHGRYSFAKIWSWIKGKLTSDSGVDISGNAATASDAKSGSTLATTLSGKAPTNHASSEKTYGVGTTSNYGHVKLATGDMNGATHSDGVAVSKNHTHSQYLTSHQSISGKMNTSADNAASGALQNLTAQLNEDSSNFTDGTEIYSSYAGNSGFGTTGYVNKPYRRKASSMWNYINSKLVIERSPASVGTSHKRIQLGYGGYTKDNVGYCCYLVHIFFNYVDDNLVGKGVTVLVNYDWRKTAYQSAKCQILNDNGLSAAGYNVVLANFKTDNNTNLHITLGLVKNTAPTTLVGFSFSYCKIMRIAYGLDWTESVTSDNVGTYDYLIPAEFGKADSFSTSVNAGSANQPVYFNNGVPTVCNWWVS